MEIRLTLGRKNLLRDFSSRERKCFSHWYLSLVFKEITPTISLKNISLISILQNSSSQLQERALTRMIAEIAWPVKDERLTARPVSVQIFGQCPFGPRRAVRARRGNPLWLPWFAMPKTQQPSTRRAGTGACPYGDPDDTSMPGCFHTRPARVRVTVLRHLGWQRQGRRPWRWGCPTAKRHRQASLDAATRGLRWRTPLPPGDCVGARRCHAHAGAFSQTPNPPAGHRDATAARTRAP